MVDRRRFGRLAALFVGLFTATICVMVQQAPAFADPCQDEMTCTGGEDGSFSGQALFTTKGKVFDPGGGGDGSTAGGTWSTRQQCELGGWQTCNTGMRCDSDDDGSEDARYMEVRYLPPDGGDWRRVGGYCEGEEQPVSIEDIAAQVAPRWKQHMPELHPTMQPPNHRTLVGLRSVFDAGPGNDQKVGPVNIPVYQFEIALTAKGKWFWQFESGVPEEEFDIPGSHAPEDTRVGHVYTKTGQFSPSVRSEWAATFMVGDRGPYTFPEPATREPVSIDITVVEKQDVLRN